MSIAMSIIYYNITNNTYNTKQNNILCQYTMAIKVQSRKKIHHKVQFITIKVYCIVTHV
jgi:hypothetical protein